MWELDYKESWAVKDWCHWIVVLEKTLESPLDCKEIQPVHSEGDQPWDFFGTKEPLDESERGQWKSWLKTQHSENWDHGIWSHHFMAHWWGNSGRLYFGAPKSLQMMTAPMKLKDDCSLEEKYDQPRQHIKRQRHYFANKGLFSQGYGFSNIHVWMWELDYKESWAVKDWCHWIVVLEKSPAIPLDCKEIQSVHRKGNQSWIFIGRTDAEAETPILRPPDGKK